MSEPPQLSAAPVLSTPDARLLSETIPSKLPTSTQKLSEEELFVRYEIERTISEIKSRRWRRIALQFPDQMLPDSVRVYQLLARGLKDRTSHPDGKIESMHTTNGNNLEHDVTSLSLNTKTQDVRLTILADTSYGACCVDEIAAEHVNADAVIHYGRSCLSPTARLPVLHVFTHQPLDREPAIKTFQRCFTNLNAMVVVTADTPYSHHVSSLCERLTALGYTGIYPASIVHDPSSPIPNRTVPTSVNENTDDLAKWHLFHVSEPPTSLLLSVKSRMASVYIYSTADDSSEGAKSVDTFTAALLRRRYALITSLTTVSIWGILVNTLSVKNYLEVLDHVRSRITQAGKKSYLFVVGKLNAAKVANFSEIGGWVVIGCWESSLIDSKEFYRPIITPFELDLALQPDYSRTWTGNWRSDFEAVLSNLKNHLNQNSGESSQLSENVADSNGIEEVSEDENENEDEDEPPEFDLRTGRYVSRSRPMQQDRQSRQISGLNNTSTTTASTAVAKRATGDMIAVNGVVSPAAEFLANKRTWQGLGSDFEIRYEDDSTGSGIEEGRTGVARGYTVGDSSVS